MVLLLADADAAYVEEEVVAFIIHEDESGEVFHFDAPDGFHAKFGVFEYLDFFDMVLREDGGGTADAPEVTVFVTFQISNILCCDF